MGTVTALAGKLADMNTSDAAGRFLEHIKAERGHSTWVRYGRVIGPFTELFGDLDPAELDPDEISEWFTYKWADGSASNWNTNRAALSSMGAWWMVQPGLPSDSPFVRIGRKPNPESRDRTIPEHEVDRLLHDSKIPLRERLFWSMLYDSAARAAEVLGLDITDLDRSPQARRATVTRKGGATDVIVWSPRTNRQLGQYLSQRGNPSKGPLFVTEREAKSDALHLTGDIAPTGEARLSYDRAKELFSEYSGGRTLHMWRHTALTRLAEQGMSANMMMTVSGHRSIRSLARYTHPSAEAAQRWREEHDPEWKGRKLVRRPVAWESDSWATGLHDGREVRPCINIVCQPIHHPKPPCQMTCWP